MIIRPERPSDQAPLRALHEAAFGQAQQADLVDALRALGLAQVSLVAEEEGALLGHVLLSRIELESAGRAISAACLGPIGVIPTRQRQGIGSRLMQASLEGAREQGIAIVVLVGHADYYPRFGFSSGRARSIASPYTKFGDVWMAAELIPGSLSAPATATFPAPWPLE